MGSKSQNSELRTLKSSLRVGLNCHLLPAGAGYRSAGVAVYVQQLMDRLPRVAPENEYIFFTPPDVTPWDGTRGDVTPPNVRGLKTIPARLPTRHPIGRILWEQTVAPWLIPGAGLDVLHSPVNVAPLFLTSASVITVHDLSHLIHPERFLPAKRLYLTALVRASVQRAAHIIVPSRVTADDLARFYAVDDNRISVVPHGVDERYRRLNDAAAPLDGPYILYVGTIEPRKNLDVLVRAYARLVRRGYPHRLVLVGGRGWLYGDVLRHIGELGLRDRIIEMGFVPDLTPWYNFADLFVYPSAYEGFGLPPLEAMACGTPVVTTSGGSLVEVVGDAALTVAPGDEEALVHAMVAVLDRPSLVQQLVAAGLRRAAARSWDDTARATAAVYRRVSRQVRSSRGG